LVGDCKINDKWESCLPTALNRGCMTAIATAATWGAVLGLGTATAAYKIAYLLHILSANKIKP
jgi:hypothetical protein